MHFKWCFRHTKGANIFAEMPILVETNKQTNKQFYFKKRVEGLSWRPVALTRGL